MRRVPGRHARWHQYISILPIVKKEISKNGMVRQPLLLPPSEAAGAANYTHLTTQLRRPEAPAPAPANSHGGNPHRLAVGPDQVRLGQGRTEEGLSQAEQKPTDTAVRPAGSVPPGSWPAARVHHPPPMPATPVGEARRGVAIGGV